MRTADSKAATGSAAAALVRAVATGKAMAELDLGGMAAVAVNEVEVADV